MHRPLFIAPLIALPLVAGCLDFGGNSNRCAQENEAGEDVRIKCSDARAADKAENRRAKAIEAALDEAVAAGFSGVVHIVDDSRLHTRAAGDADREQGVPNGIEVAYDAGSIMKEMTAALIFELERQGRLSRADTLGDWLEAVPEDKAAITLTELLRHQAGFGEYHDALGDFEPMDRAEAVARILAQPLRFSPGRDRGYSNSGYTLLAAIAEDAGEADFPTLLRLFVFEPARMTRSGLYGDPAIGAAAVGYGARRHGEVNGPGGWPSASWALVGNGGLVTTPLDLAQFTLARRSGQILPGESGRLFQEEHLDTGALADSGDTFFAFAGGNDFGFGALLIEVPARNITVTVVSNDASTWDEGRLETSLMEALLGDPDAPSDDAQ